MLELNQEFWDNKYKEKSFGWDLGEVSPPLKEYFNQLRDKNISILIAGCGNSYEAEYLVEKGFSNIALIDISPTLCDALTKKFKNYSSVKIICGNFFEHKGKYDLIVEQTFFCALLPKQRPEYCKKMSLLLSKKGKLVGLLFDRIFEAEGPPFGGLKKDYVNLFENYFNLKTMEPCYNSNIKRTGTELFFIANLITEINIK